MARTHTASLYIGAEGEATLDTAVDTFDGYHVVLDCFEAGTPFTFTFYRSEAALSSWSRIRARARVGAPVIFRIDGILVFNGHIEELEEVVDRGGSGSGAHLVVKGRDLVGKARDWDADPATAFQGLSLYDGCERVLSRLGLDVTLGVDADLARELQAGKLRSSRTLHARAGNRGGRRQGVRRDPNGRIIRPDGGGRGHGVRRDPNGQAIRATGSNARRGSHHRVDRMHPRAGEKMWQLCEQMVRRAGLWMWTCPMDSADHLGVVIGSFDYQHDSGFSFVREREPFAGQNTGNVLWSSERVSTRTVPTEVRVFGHCALGDKHVFRYGAVHPTPGTTNDLLTNDRITRGRVHVPHPHQPVFHKSRTARTYAESDQEAQRMYAKAMMTARVYSCVVAGHGENVRNEGFRLYHHNTTAPVRDDEIGINERMFLHRVEFMGKRGSSGEVGTSTRLTFVPLEAVQLSRLLVEP